MIDCDALVVGAGPAGSSVAILLARAGWKVVIVEKAHFPRRKVCGEYISGAAWPLLQELGVEEPVVARAGPEVDRVGLFAGDATLEAPMPQPANGGWRNGRALGREHLDTILLERAIACGAETLQPCSVTRIARSKKGYACTIEGRNGARVLIARTVIAAHGAWEPGGLPTQHARTAAVRGDLLGFKAHFRDARLRPGLMPLVLFPGGYGGLVHSDGGRVGFSCCMRREALAGARRSRRGARAGEALLAHVLAANRGMREALEGASLDGVWLSAGPIRPAIRRFRSEGVFVIGNAAGEAHPLIAEGISMAIQSAFLLAEPLVRCASPAPEAAHDAVAREYEAAWRRNFASRVHAAALFARLTVAPLANPMAVQLVKRLPSILTLGARWSGKDLALRRLALAEDRP